MSASPLVPATITAPSGLKKVSKSVAGSVRSTVAPPLVSQGRPAVQRTASRVYDEYLRANRVADGTASYSRALQMILSPKFRETLASYTITR
jgi:hypothetical protein